MRSDLLVQKFHGLVADLRKLESCSEVTAFETREGVLLNLPHTKKHTEVPEVVSHSLALDVTVDCLILKEPECDVLDVGSAEVNHLLSVMDVKEVFFGDLRLLLLEHDAFKSVAEVDLKNFVDLVKIEQIMRLRNGTLLVEKLINLSKVLKYSIKFGNILTRLSLLGEFKKEVETLLSHDSVVSLISDLWREVFDLSWNS